MKQLLETYPDIKNSLEALINDERSRCRLEGRALKVYIGMINKEITITASQLEQLCDCSLVSELADFEYLGSYGIRFEDYHEVCLYINHNYRDLYDESNIWKIAPLRFKIGLNQVEIGPISSLMVLLTEPIYSENNAGHTDFGHYASIKVVLSGCSDHQSTVTKTLYYLNSHYLKPIGSKAEIVHLELPYKLQDVWEAEEKILEKSSKVPRKRNLRRKDFKNIEPLILYNNAVLQSGEPRFLQLYRVIEFFLDRTMVDDLCRMRYDTSVTEEEIIKMLRFTKEKEQVSHLLKRALPKYDQERLAEYAYRFSLIKSVKFNNLPEALYEYRNSLVHAKKTELDRTTFPDPFDTTDFVENWNHILEVIARKCIIKYNTQKV